MLTDRDIHLIRLAATGTFPVQVRHPKSGNVHTVVLLAWGRRARIRYYGGGECSVRRSEVILPDVLPELAAAS